MTEETALTFHATTASEGRNCETQKMDRLFYSRKTISIVMFNLCCFESVGVSKKCEMREQHYKQIIPN